MGKERKVSYCIIPGLAVTQRCYRRQLSVIKVLSHRKIQCKIAEVKVEFILQL